MSRPGRRQVTAFLPEVAASVVDAVRAVHDPVMARIIPAHVTLLHEVPADRGGSTTARSAFEERLRDATTCEPPFRLRLGAVRCWDGDPAGGSYLEVVDLDGGIERVRESLGFGTEAPPGGPVFVPHVTLVHPRTTDEHQRRDAWDALRSWEPGPDTVVVEWVAVTRTTADGCVTLARYPLGGTAPPR